MSGFVHGLCAGEKGDSRAMSAGVRSGPLVCTIMQVGWVGCMMQPYVSVKPEANLAHAAADARASTALSIQAPCVYWCVDAHGIRR